MLFTFIDYDCNVLFIREDAERAEWTQEEMTLNLDFPYIKEKEITTGQRIWFRDPATNAQQVYEVRQVKGIEPDSVQQVVAEHICIAELTDAHIDNSTQENKPLQTVLAAVLKGTGWGVGNVETNPTSSVEISRGSVWQAVLQIRNNYNVYLEPRTTLQTNGTVNRKLDIKKTSGTWNGLRLSIDKNFLDPSVTIDDTNVATALYGYGGTIIATEQGQENKEVNFADVVWSKTADHPAKPKGQKYLEDPDATKKYGRNGKPRFGFYQNTEITNPNTLLQKVWETLKTINTPDVSVEGTVADLYRMGYADQPVKLHDIALVEVGPYGFKKQIQIIRMTVDLLDPSATTLTIGSYIPNIVYMEKQTYEQVTGSPGGSGGGGGGGGNRSGQSERQEFETQITANNQMIQLRAYQNDLDDLDNEVKRQDAAITVEHNRITAEVTDRREADKELSGKITVTANAVTTEVKAREKADKELSGKIEVTATQITQKVTDTENRLTAEIKINADNIRLKVDKNGVISAINVSPESVDISASRINLTGYVTASDLESTNAAINNLESGVTTASVLRATSLYGTNASTTNLSVADSLSIYGHGTSFKTVTVGGTTYHLLGY